MVDIHETYMQRCIELALLGEGHVAPNPMVGAVLVHAGRIIGEGYHQQYGKAHAEVNCMNNVAESDKALIKEAILYVSLEPCAHFGKTPPCTDLIIEKGIEKVFIGCRDPFEAVNGKGIEKLQNAGVEVVVGVLEKECRLLNVRFFTFHTQQRPYIILKWAQTADFKMAGADDDERLLITNEYTNRLVHQWRSREAAILVGRNTALKDDPSLDNRLFNGPSPVRMVIDPELRLPHTLKLFDHQQRTVVFNYIQREEDDNLLYYAVEPERNMLPQILRACYKLNLQSLLVEGGASLLRSFIANDLWDEARVITNEELTIGDGLVAPDIEGEITRTEKIDSDVIRYYNNSNYRL